MSNQEQQDHKVEVGVKATIEIPISAVEVIALGLGADRPELVAAGERRVRVMERNVAQVMAFIGRSSSPGLSSDAAAILVEVKRILCQKD